ETELVEHAPRRADAGLEENALLEPRDQREVVSLKDVRLAAVVRREGEQARRRQTDERRLQIVEAADLIAAAARQVRIARRREAERPVVAAAIVALIDRHRLVAELPPVPAAGDRHARRELVLRAD